MVALGLCIQSAKKKTHFCAEETRQGICNSIYPSGQTIRSDRLFFALIFLSPSSPSPSPLPLGSDFESHARAFIDLYNVIRWIYARYVYNVLRPTLFWLVVEIVIFMYFLFIVNIRDWAMTKAFFNIFIVQLFSFTSAYFGISAHISKSRHLFR